MRGEPIHHREVAPLRCSCGYEATDANDLAEHLFAMRDDVT